MTPFGDDLDNEHIDAVESIHFFMADLRTSKVEVDGITIRQDLKGELDSLKPDLTFSIITISIREEDIRSGNVMRQ